MGTEVASRSIGVLGALLTGGTIMWIIAGPTAIVIFEKIFTVLPLWAFIVMVFIFIMIWRK